MVLTGGCTTTKQYTTLADAGSAYTGAVAAMAEKASAVRLESSSYLLFQQRDSLSTRFTGKPLKDSLRVLLGRTNNNDRNTVRHNSVLKNVATSLKAYFDKLGALSRSSSPEDIGKKTDELVKQVNTAVRAATPGTAYQIPSGLPAVTQAVSGNVVESMLKQELTRRKDTIDYCVEILDSFTNELESDITGDVKIIRSYLYTANVKNRYESKAALLPADLQSVVDYRKTYLMGDTASSEIAAAKKASKVFKDKFDRMTTPGASDDGVDELREAVNELQAFTSFIKSL
jgi:hypothetical protein